MGPIKRYAACFAFFAGLCLCSGISRAQDTQHWSTVWAAAMLHAPVPANDVRPMAQVAPRLHNQTLRQLVTLSAGGRSIRIRLSNAFGDQPLRIDAASVGRSVDGKTGALDASTLHALSFNGKPAVVIPRGGVRYSDPVDLPVRAGEMLGISLYVAGAVVPSTWHPDARRDNFISTSGNYTANAVMPVGLKTGAVLWLSGVGVQTDHPFPVLVTLGDSITNGYRSRLDARHGYPQDLARRLRTLHPACHVVVVDVGIDGNEISGKDGDYGQGPYMEGRFERDVLAQHGVRFVLLLGGINDIGETTMALRIRGATLDGDAIATNVIAAQRSIIAKAHAAGLHIIGATLPPFEDTLGGAYSAAGEQARERINHWIRHDAKFDGVVDFSAVLQDPVDPERLRRVWDSGDHIHPNDKGYAAMAAAVPPALLGCP